MRTIESVRKTLGRVIAAGAMTLLPFLQPAGAATTRIWTNVVANPTWSDAASWSNGLPVNGDSVVLLRHPLGLAQNAVNDLTNLTLSSLRCEALGYTLNGAALRITDEIRMGGPTAGANMIMRSPLEIAGPTFNIISTNGAELNLSNPVTAPATTVVTVEGGVRWSISPASDYQAETRFRIGFVPLLSTRLNGPVIIGGTATNFASVVLQSGNVFGQFPPLTVLTNGSVFNISTFQAVGPLTVDGGILRLGNRSPNGSISVNGDALLTGGASIFVSAINAFGPGELSVTGRVTIAGCSLSLQPGSSPLAPPGIIVRNDGTDPINGTFTDLPQGAFLTNGTTLYAINYAGGDGNDITLTATNPPAPVVTRVWTNIVGSASWSNAANWSNGVPVDGESVLLLRHPLGLGFSAVNDLTNLSLSSLRCEAIGYNLSGGTVRLSGDVLMGGPVAGATLNISAPVEIPGPTLNIVSTNSAQLNLTGVVNAPASAVVTIDGGLQFRASPASDYRAETHVRSGFFALLFTRLKGPLAIGGGNSNQFANVALQSGNLFGDFPPLTILTNGSLFNVSTFNTVGPLTLNGGDLRLGVKAPQGELTVNGNARLTGGSRLFVSASSDFGPGELSVTGSVTIAGCSLGFNPGSASITRPSVIIRNDGTDAVTGAFDGLPEGGSLTNDTVRYVVSYVGGDGNDISLSPIVEPAQFVGTTLVDGARQYTVQGQPGFTYVIEATTNLLSPPAQSPWVPIRTNGTLANGQFPFTDLEATNFPQRFYRVFTR